MSLETSDMTIIILGKWYLNYYNYYMVSLAIADMSIIILSKLCEKRYKLLYQQRLLSKKKS